MDPADLVHATIRYLTPKCSAAERAEYVDALEADAAMHSRIAAAKSRRRFRLNPDPQAR